MHLVTFDRGHGPEAGVLRAGPTAAATAGTDLKGTEGTAEGAARILAFADLDAGLPATLVDLIAQGAGGLARLRAALGAATLPAGFELGQARLLAPIPRPARNVFCVGKNYVEHAKEFQGSGFDSSSAGQDVPDVPIIFTKAPSSVIGPGGGIDSTLDPTATLDYEGELAVIIGPGGRGITRAQAMAHVWGYTIVNDVTARQTQSRHRQWFLGKSPDTFCPMGPTLVTADAVPDVTALRLITRVNGEVRQDARLADLIFDIPAIIETISAAITLEAGDIIATGTPVGVGIGYKPPRYMRPGDRVSVQIDPIGTLENPVI